MLPVQLPACLLKCSDMICSFLCQSFLFHLSGRTRYDRSDLKPLSSGPVIFHIFDVVVFSCFPFLFPYCQIGVGILGKPAVLTDLIKPGPYIHGQIIRIIICGNRICQVSFARQISVRKDGYRQPVIRHGIINLYVSLPFRHKIQKLSQRKAAGILLSSCPVFDPEWVADCSQDLSPRFQQLSGSPDLLLGMVSQSPCENHIIIFFITGSGITAQLPCFITDIGPASQLHMAQPVQFQVVLIWIQYVHPGHFPAVDPCQSPIAGPGF